MVVEIYVPHPSTSPSEQDLLLNQKLKKWFSETLHRIAGFDGEPHGISTVEKLKLLWMDCNARPVKNFEPLKMSTIQRAYFRRRAGIIRQWEAAGKRGIHFYVCAAHFSTQEQVLVHIIWDDWYFFIAPPTDLIPSVIKYAKAHGSFIRIPELNLKVVRNSTP